MIYRQSKKNQKVSKLDFQLQVDDLDTTFHATEKSSEDEKERFEDNADEQPKESAFLFIGRNPFCKIV